MKPRHIRTLSDSSDTPLIEPMHNKRTLRLPSTTSSDSEIYFVPTQSYDAKFRSDGPEPPIPISKEPPPPPSLTTAEHQLTALVSRPSYLAKPRRAPRPGSRGLQGAHDTLKRLTSTRSKKRSRSVDDADSPSSVYSQMSAAPAAYHSFADLPSAFIGEHVPPVPPLPTQYQQRPLGAGVWQQGVPPETTATSAEASRGSEMGSEISSPLPLEDSHAFPLPVVNDPSSPNAQWFSTLWANPSGTASPLSDFSPSNRSTVYSRYSNVLGVRSLEVSSGMPQYNSGSQGEARKGTVGYQLPLNWRRENALTAMSALQR
ncbi:uncharacterized protein PHACADRAFT_260126 [Phanerochaete carnosa HHB-10118-sp]|uniref:Uncharacterized protein n=1 Tax=Phanerochaete carnosa (strain HHB-10118-sp) TaxID=650164 RepID=K5W3E3_PHACS|nr:uncharacterized protein PHACADRAFT_260126 [Phanerochaete carnosa HHB-10118-sp]EKM53655.1 hypothetical protein PHACADRAFT_260126 [Phanerochaete carnosa HHB-10118-sp]